MEAQGDHSVPPAEPHALRIFDLASAVASALSSQPTPCEMPALRARICTIAVQLAPIGKRKNPGQRLTALPPRPLQGMALLLSPPTLFPFKNPTNNEQQSSSQPGPRAALLPSLALPSARRLRLSSLSPDPLSPPRRLPPTLVSTP